MPSNLYYVHDPMCSWCYGFGPMLEKLMAALPADVRITRLLGGLAPDCDAPMSPEMRMRLQQTWHRIQHRLPGTLFNFDFWTRCEPRRSTWPACRAVIAARRQEPEFDLSMTRAIQHAYYRQARNPSRTDTLIELAGEIGADTDRFAAALDAPETRLALQQEMEQARALGADSFPALVLVTGQGRRRIPVDYEEPARMATAIRDLSDA